MLRSLPLFCAILIVISCGQSSSNHYNEGEATTFHTEYAAYIKAYTSGTISKQSNIRIAFTEAVTIPADIEVGELFDIVPYIKGTVVKTGDHEVTFSPEEHFASGEQYTFGLNVKALVSDIAEGFEMFEIKIKIIDQDFDASLQPIEARDPSQPDVLSLSGTIKTADYAKSENAEKMLTLPSDLTANWQHISGTIHRFEIAGLKRSEKPSTLELTASGNPIGLPKSQQLKADIPSSGIFSVMSHQVTVNGNPYVSIFFSDPLDPKQNLKGLIQIDGIKSPRMVINGNELKVYVPANVAGSKKLEVSQGIKNSRAKVLETPYTNYVAFQPENPQVKLIGSGTILPSTDGLVLPFEAVNLKSVRIEIVQIFENNLPQFFQKNNLKGTQEQIRVGQKIANKRISLENQAADLSTWNRFTLELSSLIQSSPGSLYQIRIGFSPEDTNYPCSEAFNDQEDQGTNDWSIYNNDGFSTYGNLWSNRYPRGYNWSDRENPCKVSYYTSSRSVTTSLFATDIGLIAKIGADNQLSVIATNMKTANPISASIKVLDFQLQEINVGMTDQNGMATFSPSKRPFLVIAEIEGQSSYLRLNDNESLSMSNFDVSGKRIKGNIKGYIYGERGVWRPGDDIFLSFMLEDPEKSIPSDHPIVMELRDPRGTVQDKQILTESTNGLYTFKTSTANDAPTGFWNSTISLGNNQFSKTIKVETIKPNRLKINLDLGDDVITYTERNLTGTMDVNWLTGLKGSNLKVETELRLSATNTTFKGYAQYEFDDKVKTFYKDPKIVFKGEVDETGKATFSTQLPSKPNSPGAIKASFNTKAFEPGGGFSINSKSYTYLPYKSLVGINITTAEGTRIKRDSPQTVQIATLNSEGQPVDRNGVMLKIYKLNWRWWWDESNDNTTNYVSSRYANLVKEQKLNTTGGKGSAQFEIKSPDWGRYILVATDPVSGHSSSKVFYTSWYGGNESTSLGASSLEVSTDKQSYAVGENIQVTMRGSLKGQALISVENGSSVLDNFWVSSEKEWTTFQIPATEAMAPNVYLHVTLLQPHGQTSNDLPIRLYGIAPIEVFDPETKLKPEIQMADELKPGQKVDISISEESGLPMSYTIAVVDEGLLDITNFNTPNPWDHFYSKEAIGVKTWDMYDDVIGAYGGKLERLLAIGGGDGGLQDADKMQENRFKPVVQFMGPFFLKDGQTKQHSFTMPQYIGSVKTMVVAGYEGSYGSSDKQTPVVKPLMVLGTLPRVVGPGEKVSLPVNIFRFKDHIKEATIKIETTGTIQSKGGSTQKVALDKETTTIYFDLEVAQKIGIGSLKITATSGKETATHEINIASRSPNTEQTVTKLINVPAGSSEEYAIDLFGIKGSNKVSLELAAIPPINLEQRLRYLIRYPHGCIEQTVSSVFPQLYLDEITELTSEQRIKIESNIQAAIKRLQKFQSSNGGMTYWPGASRTNSWGSSYAHHFLIEAQKRGYPVPNTLITNLKNFQKLKAGQWSKSADHYNSDLIQSYRLFTLAIHGYADLGAMNRLRNISDKSYQTVCKLAAAYAAIGQKDAARSILRSSSATLTKQKYNYYYYSYGSYIRDLAIKLEAYVYLGDQEESFKVLTEISDRLSSSSWYSTQSTAYSLLAVGKYAIANKSSEPMSAQIAYGSNQTDWTSDKTIYRSEIAAKNGDQLKITNKGQANLFATVTITGTPESGKEIINSEDLSINVRYLDPKGRSVKIDSIKLGQAFDAIVTVKNEYKYGQVRDIALSHILPSGWEIVNDRLTDQETSGYSSFQFQDIRDDRVYTYFHLNREEAKTFKVSLTAAYPGAYYLPGPYAEAMYKADIHAKDSGKWVYVYE